MTTCKDCCCRNRKDGTATTQVARQYLGSVGKVDNGIVAVTSLWADERCYWPVHAVPYAPASRLPAGERDPGVQDQAAAGRRAGPGRPAGRGAVSGGGGRLPYGDNPSFIQALTVAKVRFVLALQPRKGTWAPADQAHTPVEAAGELGWRSPGRPGRWRRIQRRFRDGH